MITIKKDVRKIYQYKIVAYAAVRYSSKSWIYHKLNALSSEMTKKFRNLESCTQSMFLQTAL